MLRFNRCIRRILHTSIAIAALAFVNQCVFAVEKYWNNSAGGLFNVGANWSDGSPPGANDIATFNLQQTYFVQWDASVGNTVNQELHVTKGVVTLYSTAGQITHTLGTGNSLVDIRGGKLALSALSGASFALDVKAGISLTDNAIFELGFGSKVLAPILSLGSFGNPSGSYNRMTIRDGADVVATYLTVGATENGYVQIDGVGSTVLAAQITVGQGTIAIDDGGKLVSTQETFIQDGSVSVGGNGARSTWEANSIFIGQSGGSGDSTFVHLTKGDVTANSITVSNGGTLSVLDGTVTVQSLTLSGGALRLNFNSKISVDSPNSVLRIDPESVELGTLELSSNRQLHVAGTTIVESGTVIQVSDLAAFSSAQLINHGRIQVVNNSVLGNSLKQGAYSGSGELEVLFGTLTLNDAGLADLGFLTQITDGSLIAPNGVALPVGGDLVGYFGSAVNGKIATAAGSSIVAEIGSMTLGNASSVVGISIGGELRVNESTVSLLDANSAELGTLTTIGRGGVPGTLNIANGAIIDLSDNIVGFGTVASPNNSSKSVRIDGLVSGDSLAKPLTFTGYVSGVGTFDNVTFTGTHSPGASIATLNVGNIKYDSTATLLIEIGGTSANTGFDQIDSSGLLQLGGKLQVQLVGSVSFILGQSFDLLTADVGIIGTFNSLLLPTISGGMTLDVLYTANAVKLRVVAANLGDFNFDGHFDAADYVVWRKKGSPQSDYNLWRANFGRALGNSSSTVTGSPSQVPEPSSLLLTLLASVVHLYCGRNRR